METANDYIDMADVTRERPTTEGLLSMEEGSRKSYLVGDDRRVLELLRALASRASSLTGDRYSVTTKYLYGYATVTRKAKEGGVR